MAKARVLSGTMIYRKIQEEGGLQETKQSFHSLDELFTLALEAKEPFLVDRIVINGEDQNASRRLLTFVFQSITVSDAEAR